MTTALIRALAFAAFLLALLVPVASAQADGQGEACVILYAFDYDLGPYHVSNPNNIKLVCVYCPVYVTTIECRDSDA